MFQKLVNLTPERVVVELLCEAPQYERIEERAQRGGAYASDLDRPGYQQPDPSYFMLATPWDTRRLDDQKSLADDPPETRAFGEKVIYNRESGSSTRVPLRSTPEASIRRYADRVEVDVWPEDAPDFYMDNGAFWLSPETVTIEAPRPLAASDMPIWVEQEGLIRPLDDPSSDLRVVRISVPVDRDWMIAFLHEQTEDDPQEPVFYWQSSLMAIAMMLAHPDRPCWARLESKGPWISRLYWERSTDSKRLVVPPGICISGLPEHQPCIASQISGPLTWDSQSVHIQRFAPLLDVDLAFAFPGASGLKDPKSAIGAIPYRQWRMFSRMLCVWTTAFGAASVDSLRNNPEYYDYNL